jgi:hypothetical protein
MDTDNDLAPLWRRAAAWAIDLAALVAGGLLIGFTITAGSVLLLRLVGSPAQSSVIAAGNAGVVGMAVAFCVALSCDASGRPTAGRALLRIRLVDVAGDPPGVVRAMSRRMWTVLATIALVATVASALRQPRRVLLHDRWSHTRITRI